MAENYESPLARAISKARGDIRTDEDMQSNIDFLNNAARQIKEFSESPKLPDSLQLLIEFRDHVNRRISQLSTPASAPPPALNTKKPRIYPTSCQLHAEGYHTACAEVANYIESALQPAPDTEVSD